MEETTKICLHCGKAIRGRSDKKFCDDYCRNNFNNQLKAHSNNYVRNVNNTLSKNRRILGSLLPSSEEINKTTKQQLLQQGFSFKYLTHTYVNKKGNTYFFCYDYGYLPLENDWYLIVEEKKNK